MSGGGGPRRSSLCGHYDEPWGTASDDRRRPHLVPSVMDPAGCVGLVGGTVGDELPHYVPSELQVSRRATVPRARQGSGIPPTLRPPFASVIWLCLYRDVTYFGNQANRLWWVGSPSPITPLRRAAQPSLPAPRPPP